MITKNFAVTTRSAGLDPLECIVRMSTADVDREGDTINPSGWKLDAFMRSPCVLLGHDYKSLPVARVVDLAIEGNALVGRVRFPTPGISPRADEARSLVKEGFLTAVSVGFAPIRSTPNKTRGGIDFHEQELLELSFVSVPANANALVTAKAHRGDEWIELPDLGDEIEIIDYSVPLTRAMDAITRAAEGMTADDVRAAYAEARSAMAPRIKAVIQREVAMARRRASGR